MKVSIDGKPCELHKNEKEFKVGDRVTAKGNVDGYEGAGTIVEVDPNPRTNFSYLLRFDCGPKAIIWAYNDSVKHIERKPTQTIVIHQSGPITKAILKEGKTTIRTAEAKCSPHDTYDFATGARIAFNRLMGMVPVAPPKPAEKPAQELIKLYCVKPLSVWLTVGKTYESVNGWMTVDSGGKCVDSVMRQEGYLVPLVKRRAKVGEWVYATYTNPELYHYGEVSRVIKTDTDKTVMLEGNKRYPNGRWISDSRYLVLDGYKGPDKL